MQDQLVVQDVQPGAAIVQDVAAGASHVAKAEANRVLLFQAAAVEASSPQAAADAPSTQWQASTEQVAHEHQYQQQKLQHPSTESQCAAQEQQSQTADLPASTHSSLPPKLQHGEDASTPVNNCDLHSQTLKILEQQGSSLQDIASTAVDMDNQSAAQLQPLKAHFAVKCQDQQHSMSTQGHAIDEGNTVEPSVEQHGTPYILQLEQQLR